MSASEDFEVFDDAVLRLIELHAKPTTTLAHLKGVASNIMDESTVKMALGRLWRSVQILRSPAPNGQVLYWTVLTARAVAASGVKPEMPPGVDIPEYAKTDFRAKPNHEAAIPPEQKPSATPVLTKVKTRSGLLVPPSETAALPMRPDPEGEPGGIRRGAITSKVASAMFKYRDVRLSIDGATSLCPGVSRTDVARVISQLSSQLPGKDYFIRFEGATRYENTYQWNKKYRYPFAARYPDDGVGVPLYNAEEVEDAAPLDHLPTEQLTEDETESEIARLIRENAEVKAAEEKVGMSCPMPDGSIVTAPYAPPSEPDITVNEDSDGDEGTCDDSLTAGISSGSAGLSIPRAATDNFRAALFSDGELLLIFGDEKRQLTKQQADQLISLLGPHYAAKRA
jgi:hypothetical protein